MIRILHTADWHLGKRLQEFSRLEEQKLVLEEIQDIADREDVDLVLIAGDIFDTFNPQHEAVELFYKSLKRLSKQGARPVIAIAGNHDSTQFIEAPDPLAREMGIFLYGKYDSIIRTGSFDTGIKINRSDHGFIELVLPDISYPIRIILAPYASESSLKVALGEENREEEFRNILGQMWQGIADQYCDKTGINLFVGHYYFAKEGSKMEEEPESERPILHIGGAQALFSRNIPEQIQYAALGHLHRYHAVSAEPCPVVYASSPLSYSFSEAHQDKQVVVVEIAPGEAAKYKPIKLTKGRPLYRKSFDNLSDTLLWLKSNLYCFVEITYETDTSIDQTTRRAIMKAHDGIVFLIPKIRNPLGKEHGLMTAEDMRKDIGTLFSLYYQSVNGATPDSALMAVFKEVIGQNELR